MIASEAEAARMEWAAMLVERMNDVEASVEAARTENEALRDKVDKLERDTAAMFDAMPELHAVYFVANVPKDMTTERMESDVLAKCKATFTRWDDCGMGFACTVSREHDSDKRHIGTVAGVLLCGLSRMLWTDIRRLITAISLDDYRFEPRYVLREPEEDWMKHQMKGANYWRLYRDPHEWLLIDDDCIMCEHDANAWADANFIKGHPFVYTVHHEDVYRSTGAVV